MKNILNKSLLFLFYILAIIENVEASDVKPYTQGAREVALEMIGNNIALFPDSRYSYVQGKKIRLDDNDKLGCWSVMRNGKLYVPIAFANVIASDKVDFDNIPADLSILEDRWVYVAKVKKIDLSKDIKIIDIKGKKYFAAEDLALYLNKSIYKNNRGLLLIGNNKISYNADKVEDDCVVTLFDTPEKYADPDVATEYIPYLRKQGKWYEHARVTNEQLRDLEYGEEEEWYITPKNEYDLEGFNSNLLGSKVPPPGVYPRILFSPKDIPMLRKHIEKNVSAQKGLLEIEVLLKKTWLDEKTSDGRIFKMLYDGNIDEIKKNMEVPKEGAAVYHVARLTSDHNPGIYNSHVTYVTNCLTTMALYALITNNDDLGRKAANALVTYFKLIEPRIEKHLKTTDSEFGVNFDGGSHSTTHWRGMHGVVPHMDLAFALDFGGKWMNKRQIKFMQNIIAKATYGRRTGAGDGPQKTWRDQNHMTWHLTHLLALTAIEGCEGFDEEAYLSGKELVRDFLEFGIDKNGHIFESNGKSGGGIQFQILSMISEARRGNNLWGHPHWRKLTKGLLYTTSPNGKETVSSGTWGASPFSFQATQEIKAFFPKDRNADFLLSSIEPDFDCEEFDLEAYKAKLEKNINRVRLPGPAYPSLVWAFPYAGDWQHVTHKDEGIPLDWDTDVHGVFSTSSNNTVDASWLCFHVRDNHYIGSGHHHADAGMFYYSALNVNWITESPFPKTYSSRFHNQLLIDGFAQSEQTPAKADYLGAKFGDMFSYASADLSYAYSWTWCTQVRDWGTGFAVYNSPVYTDKVWELETNPKILKHFIGTTHYKMRIWWATSNQSNFIPTLRAPWNPVKYVYRTAGMVKGDTPFAIICDDACKDDNKHLYQWTAMLGKGVWKADVEGINENSLILGYEPHFNALKSGDEPPALKPKKGDPLLMVCAVGMKPSDVVDMKFVDVEIAKDGPEEKGVAQSYSRIVINQVDDEVRYRVLLIPFYFGDNLPKIDYDGKSLVVNNMGNVSRINFGLNDNGMTQMELK